MEKPTPIKHFIPLSIKYNYTLRKIFTFLLFILTLSVLTAQNNRYDVDFLMPVKHTIKLAGSFGEIRSNHFHSGIDIKSQSGSSGDSIFSTASGYVSRIKVDRSGYGNALYIDHPSGHTSVYAHLDIFNDEIEVYVKNIQNSLESWEIDVYVSNDKIPIARGEYIGDMGNTGRSYGPHLHFEIRDTKTEKPINPFLFNLKPEDTKSPLVFAVDILPLDYKNQVIDYITKYTPKNKNSGNIDLGVFEVPAWNAGVGLQVFDQMNGSSNYNSIYKLKMLVDDSLHYQFEMDSLSFFENKMINAHIAYELKKEDNRTVTCCFKTKGNTLGFLNQTPTDGKIKVYKEKDRKVVIAVSDIEGNTTTINFKLKRKEIKTSDIKFQKYIAAGVDTSVNLLGIDLHFKENSLSNDLPLFVEKNVDLKNRTIYKISDPKYPLLGYIEVAIPIPSNLLQYKNKLVLAFEDGKGKIQGFGGSVEGEKLVSSIDEFESYFMLVDTLKPKIIPGKFYSSSTTATEFTFEIYDVPEANGKSDNFQYDVYIDDIWRPCPYKSMTNTLSIPLSNLTKGNHRLKIIVVDEKENMSVYERIFKLN
jgi:hypothetical protein